MSKDNAKSLADLLSKEQSGLGKLAVEAKRREALSDYMRNALPAALAPGLMHCNVENETSITILAASPEWAARLRFASPEILEIGRRKVPGLESVKVKVAGG
jgi:hypothetical protein